MRWKKHQANSMGKRRSKTAAEHDLRVRASYCYLSIPGATDSIKRMTRRRERQEAKRSIRQEQL